MATVFTVTQALIDQAAAANVTILKDNGTGLNAGSSISHTEYLTVTCKSGYTFKRADGTRNDCGWFQTTAPTTRFYGTTKSTTSSQLGPWTSATRINSFFFDTESNVPTARVLDSSDISDFTDNHARLLVNGVNATAGLSVKVGDTLTAIADEGYTFQAKETDKISVFTSNVSGDTFYFTKGADLTRGTYKVGTELGYFFVTTEVVVNPIRNVVASDLSTFTAANATLNINGVPATLGAPIYAGDVLQAVAKSEYVFTAVAPDKISAYHADAFGDDPVYFVRDSEELISGSTTVVDVVGVFHVSTVKKDVPPTPIRTLDQDDIDVFTSNHAKLFLRDVLAKSGDSIYEGDKLSVVADTGWTFVQPTGDGVPNNAISAYWLDLTGYPTYFLRTGADFTRGQILATSPIGMFVTTVVIVQPEDVKGFNNVYEVTDEQLQLIARKRFVVEEGQPEESSNTVDYGVYILGLIDLPFKIDPTMIIDQQLINLGPLKTDVSASFLNTDTLRLSLGSINVVGTKGNFLDYQDTVIMLHLPYSESVAIEPKYAINETISVEYLISLYDGVAIMNVKSSKTDSVIITQNVDLNISVPFANTQAVPSRNDPSSVKLGGDNGLKTAFIEILRNNAVLERGFFTTPIVDEGPLSAYNGFARIEDIVLKSKATSQEKDLIESQLKNGVYVK